MVVYGGGGERGTSMYYMGGGVSVCGGELVYMEEQVCMGELVGVVCV